MWSDVVGMPTAPLVGEQLTTIDFKFMKTKAKLLKEFPLLSLEELAE
jgi:hypothetical protein